MRQPNPEDLGPALGDVTVRRALGQTRQAWQCVERNDDTGGMALLAAQRRDAAGDPIAELVALIGSALIGALTGRLREARTDLTDAEHRLAGLGVAGLRPHWEQAALVCEWMAGDWRDAEHRSAQLVRFPPAPPRLTLCIRLELITESVDPLGRAGETTDLINRLGELPASAMTCCAIASTKPDPAEALQDLSDAACSEQLGMLPMALYRMARCARELGDQARVANARAVFDQLGRSDPLATILAELTEALATQNPRPARRAQELAEAETLRPLTAESLTLQADLGYFPNGTLRAARDHWLAIGADLRADRLSDRLGDPQPRRLTPREVELVGYVQSGLSNREIAERAHLSAKSVEGYLTRIYLKTGCHSRVELAVAAVNGQIPRTARTKKLDPPS